MEMCKFPNRNAEGYRRTLGHIKRLVAAAGGFGGPSADSRSESGDSASVPSSVTALNRGLFIEAAPHGEFHDDVSRNEEACTQKIVR